MGNIFQGGGKYTENAVRDGRKYFVKYFGRSRNTMNNIFLLRMGGIRSYQETVFRGLFGDIANVLGILFVKQKITRTIPWLRRPLNADARFQFRVIPYWICSEKSGNLAGFSYSIASNASHGFVHLSSRLCKFNN